ncbi:MAG: hypothetical protein HKN68_13550 [Saprospiraceae bacterium]|nr:hypothetical protein [Saprospiraceae bacterium]
METKKASHLRIVKNDEIGKEEDLEQRLRAVHEDMERIINLIDSSIDEEGKNSSIAQ